MMKLQILKSQLSHSNTVDFMLVKLIYLFGVIQIKLKKYCSYCNGTGYSLLSSHNDAQDSFSNRKYYTENYSDMYAHNPLYNTNSQNQNNHNFHHNYHDSHSFYTSNNNYFQNNTCAYCNGNGNELCRSCDNGRIGCRMCDKSGYLRWYIELQVKYENNLDDYLKKNSHKPLSDMLIRNCIGEKIFTEKKSQVYNYFKMVCS